MMDTRDRKPIEIDGVALQQASRDRNRRRRGNACQTEQQQPTKNGKHQNQITIF